MKRLLTIAAALLACIFTFSSCGNHTGTVVTPNSVTATIAGVLAFSASGSYIDATKTNGTLNITATTPGKAKITMTIPSYNAVTGTMAISNIGIPVGATYDSLGNGSALLASTGTVTFTEVTPYLIGTFSFVCSDSTKITSGAFNIKAPK